MSLDLQRLIYCQPLISGITVGSDQKEIEEGKVVV